MKRSAARIQIVFETVQKCRNVLVHFKKEVESQVDIKFLTRNIVE